MKSSYNFLYVLLIFLLPSCNNRYVHETIGFQNYLKEKFDENLPVNEHTFLLISQFACLGCIESALLKISEKTNLNSKYKITIITYDTLLIPNSLKYNTKILLDTKSSYENVGLSIANIALLKTSKGKIDKIEMINLDNADKIINEEFKQ